MSIHAIESAILARLQERLGDQVRRVYSASELAQAAEQSQLTPSLAVMYNGYRTGASDQRGAVQSVTWEFMVVATVRSAKGPATQQGAREECSELLDQVLEALLGFQPLPDRPANLLLADAPGVTFSESGLAYYPLAFTLTRTHRGT